MKHDHFDLSQIATFNLADLNGRTVHIRSFTDTHVKVTIAFDQHDGSMFLLSVDNIEEDHIVARMPLNDLKEGFNIPSEAPDCETETERSPHYKQPPRNRSDATERQYDNVELRIRREPKVLNEIITLRNQGLTYRKIAEQLSLPESVPSALAAVGEQRGYLSLCRETKVMNPLPKLSFL